jgi:DNA-binding GntR family transcriptional regulator
MSDAWPLLKTATLTDQVYEVLRDRILSDTMKAGDFIREQEVSSKLGVSRTPVREALGRLASEGFLKRIPHRGYQIPSQSAFDLLELYPILASLEVLAGRHSFPKLDSEEIAELREINAHYEEACQRQDVRAGIELNNRFHHLLSAGSNNQRLCNMLDELRSEVTRLEMWAFFNTPQWDASKSEHDQILDAVERGDWKEALRVLELNRLTTYKDFNERIGEGAPSPEQGAFLSRPEFQSQET